MITATGIFLLLMSLLLGVFSFVLINDNNKSWPTVFLPITCIVGAVVLAIWKL